MHDPDEHEEEQREIELKKRLNATFKDFCLKVNKLSAPNIEFDAPYRELEFIGAYKTDIRSITWKPPVAHGFVYR